jgi:hypothetical protein
VSLLSSLPWSLMLFASLCMAQDAEPSSPAVHYSRLGIGVKMSSLGAGIDFATPLTTRSNLRTGFNIFTYGRPFDTDGFTYNGELNLRSAQINYDWFPFRNAFHLSPGLLFYNGNKITAALSVTSGKTLHLDHNTFQSDPNDPIRGNAGITFRKVAPAILFGWGNILSRTSRHFFIPFEFGVVFHGQPKLTFDLTGKGCDPKGRGCSSINAGPSGQRDIQNERDQIESDISSFRFYPVVSIGFAYKF